MKIKFSTLFSGIISFCLVLLGFSACDEADNDMPLEYGTPTALYKVKGTVISEETQTPVKNIRAILFFPYQEFHPSEYNYMHGGDTTYSDNSGQFNLKIHDFPGPGKFYLKLEDVDGKENGSFETKFDSVIFENPVFKNGKGWYKGETEKDIKTIGLKPFNEEK